MNGSPPDDPTERPKGVAGTDDTLPALEPVRATAVVAAPTPTLIARRYRVIRELGRGGMGRVVLAWDEKLGREVAIKELLVDHPMLRERFAREVHLSALLQHPAIVCLYDSVESEGGAPAYLMRVISGHPLHQLLVERPRLADRIALLPNVIQACEAVAYAHEQGVIHRDLKPANIMVGRFGETVVIDWGLAKQLHQDEPRGPPSDPPHALSPDGGLTVVGDVMGTPAFMAPEQARGEAANSRSDVYSLGAILFELLAGQAPQPGNDRAAMILALAAGPSDFGILENREVPADLLGIVRRAMCFEPAGRYASAAELAEDLRRFQTGQLVQARTYSRRELIRRWISRHRGAVRASAALVLLTGGAAGAYGSWVRVTTALCEEVAPLSPELQGRVPPACLHPLSVEAQQHRQVSYRVSTSRGRVVRIERINGSGSLTHGHLDDLARWDLTYDESGQLHEVVALNSLLDFRERWVYSADLARAERRDQRGAPLDRVTSGLATHNDASVAQRELDAQGRVVRLHYANVFGTPRLVAAPWVRDEVRLSSRGAFGFRLELAPDGEILAAVSLGLDGREHLDGDGIARREFEDDRPHHRRVERNLDGLGHLTSDRVGVGGKVTTYDAAGNIETELYFGRDGRPAPSFLGIAGYRATYDAAGNQETWTGLDAAGEPTPLDHGVTDDFGGYVTARRHYDARGINIETEFLDAQGHLMVTKVAGCARLRLVPNARGQIDEEDCFDTRGARAIYHYLGASGVRFDHDSYGYPSGMVFLGLQGEPMVSLRFGCAQIVGANDANNNTLDQRCLGLDGQPVVSDSTYAPAGYLPRVRHRYAHQHFTLDTQGRKVGEAFFDAQERPLLQREGYAAQQFRIDEAGNALETLRFGVDGGLTAGTDGVARVVAQYDAVGNRTQVENFDADGRRVASSVSGASLLRYGYDDSGRVTEISSWGPDGRRAPLTNDTYALRRTLYDDRGDEVDTRYFDSEGAPTFCRQGYAEVQFAFDDHALPYETAYFGVDGGPVMSALGYARVTHRYGPGTQLLEERFLGTDGGAAQDEFGASGYRQDYDVRGNVVRRLALGADFEAGSNREGVSLERWTYDDLDEATEWVRYGLSGSLLLDAAGSCGWRATYDAFGREVTRTRLGIDGGQPVPLATPGSSPR